MPSFRSLLGESWGETGYTAITSTKQPLQQTEWRKTEDSTDLLARQEGCMENCKAHLLHGNKGSIFFCLLRARLKKIFRHALLCHLPTYAVDAPAGRCLEGQQSVSDHPLELESEVVVNPQHGNWGLFSKRVASTLNHGAHLSKVLIFISRLLLLYKRPHLTNQQQNRK